MGWERKRRWEQLHAFGSSSGRGGGAIYCTRVVDIARETDSGEEASGSGLGWLSSRCLLSMHTKRISRQLEMRTWNSRQKSGLELQVSYEHVMDAFSQGGGTDGEMPEG